MDTTTTPSSNQVPVAAPSGTPAALVAARLRTIAAGLGNVADLTEVYADAHGADLAPSAGPVGSWDLDGADLAVWNHGFASGVRFAVRHLERFAATGDLTDVLASLAGRAAELQDDLDQFTAAE